MPLTSPPKTDSEETAPVREVPPPAAPTAASQAAPPFAIILWPLSAVLFGCVMLVDVFRFGPLTRLLFSSLSGIGRLAGMLFGPAVQAEPTRMAVTYLLLALMIGGYIALTVIWFRTTQALRRAAAPGWSSALGLLEFSVGWLLALTLAASIRTLEVAAVLRDKGDSLVSQVPSPFIGLALTIALALWFDAFGQSAVLRYLGIDPGAAAQRRRRAWIRVVAGFVLGGLVWFGAMQFFSYGPRERDAGRMSPGTLRRDIFAPRGPQE